MGVEGILEKIRQKSDQECREILETARQQAQDQRQQVLASKLVLLRMVIMYCLMVVAVKLF